MSKERCKCGSYAINPRLHGRKAGVDLHLCDVCYWRTRSNPIADKRIAELEAEKDGQGNAAIYWHGNYNNLEEAKDKRIAELEEAGRALLIDAMHMYSHYPNNFRHTVEEYFSEEIKMFPAPRHADS